MCETRAKVFHTHQHVIASQSLCALLRQSRKTKPVAGNDRDNPYDRDDLRYGNQAFNSKDANVEAHANGDNKSQHCCLLLGVFGQQCCARLHGPKV